MALNTLVKRRNPVPMYARLPAQATRYLNPSEKLGLLHANGAQGIGLPRKKPSWVPGHPCAMLLDRGLGAARRRPLPVLRRIGVKGGLTPAQGKLWLAIRAAE